ncbi:MAG: hypothetical protein KDA21_10230, partial [Phycisphaerales bacterium]|nr:hypothetical protein [Phycisphaerales bacterium]
MKLIFFGSGAFGLPTLTRLAETHELLAVVTQPDRPAGRRRQPTATPVGEWSAAQRPDLPLLKPEDVNDAEPLTQLRAMDAAAWVVIAFGQKLSQSLLADRFAINLHASLLPRWRGAAPIHRAVLAGDEITGNSVITLAERMDAGAVLGQSRRAIGETETSGDLHDLLAADGPDLVLRVLEACRAGSLKSEVQDEAAVTLARKLSREEAVVDWNEAASVCRARINGYSPWPGITIGRESASLKLLRAGPGPAVR